MHDDTTSRPRHVENEAPHWTEGTDRSFDGDDQVGTHPEITIDRFGKHLK